MSSSTTHPVAPEPTTVRTDCRTAHFATRRLEPSTTVVTAQGEIDAANAPEFVDYVLAAATHIDNLVLDLSGVDFFATAGFSALHTANVQCAGENITWVVVPSPAVDRLLRICDPDATLVTCATVEAALSTVNGESRRLLQLVTKSR